jgi:CRP-like cAMP-binding protein
MLINNERHVGLIDAYAAAGMSGSVFNRFRELMICRNMPEEGCMELFSCFEVDRIGAGEVIYEADTASDHTMRLIVEGTASVSVANSSTGIYSRLKTGDVFGLFSFLDEARPHSATLMAETDVTLLAINREYFNLITLEEPELGNQMLRFMFRLLSRMALKLESEYIAMHEFAFLR